jgi:antitoxin component YwqK of YwqJK toxin-antitoxin module
MKNRILNFALLVSLIFLGSCSNLEVAENRNEAGQLVERFTRDPKTKLKEGLHENFFTSNGGKSEESNYRAGVLHGEQVFYYESGQIMERRNYDKTGNFTGAFKAFHESGAVRSEGQYENGAMTGKWKFFYKSGNIKEIVFYRDNVENGPFIEYYENGKISAEGTYMNELEHGLLKIYDDKGNLTMQKQCENGVCRTVWKSDLAKDSAKKL